MRDSDSSPMNHFTRLFGTSPVRRALEAKLEVVSAEIDRHPDSDEAHDRAAEILTWLFTADQLRGPTQDEYQRAVLERLKDHGDVDRAIAELKHRRPVGRPVARRDLAVAVLEARITNPR